MVSKNVDVDLDFGGVNRAVGMAEPAAPGHATTKNYVDARTPKITVSATEPVAPEEGDLWVVTT